MDCTFRLPLLLAPLLMSGCAAMNPLNIPDEEWAQMSTQQRLTARQTQAELTQARLESDRQRRHHEAQLAAQQAVFEQQEREQRFRQAHYGDILQCELSATRVRGSKGWRFVQPSEFTVMRADTRQIQLYDYKDRVRKTLNVSFSERGKLELCIHPTHRHCANFSWRQRKLSRGVQTPLHMGEKLHGQLYCEFKPLRHRDHSHHSYD